MCEFMCVHDRPCVRDGVIGVQRDQPAKPHAPTLHQEAFPGTWALDTPMEPPDSLGAPCARCRGAHRDTHPELCSVSCRRESFPDGSFGSCLVKAAPAASRLLPVIPLLLSHR